MIKQRETKCWVICCDNCGAEIEENDYTPHYDTKEEAEEFAQDLIEDQDNEEMILCDGCRQK